MQGVRGSLSNFEWLAGTRSNIWRSVRTASILSAPILLLRSRRIRVGLLALGTVLLTGLVTLFLLPLPEHLRTPPSVFVTYEDGSPAYVFLSPDDKYRMRVDPHEIDPNYLAALFRFEDKRFYRHPGVDPVAIARSTVLNLRHRRVLSGASTLTMQLVRLLEPRPRTLKSKIIEAIRAIQIELRLTKQEVLTAYLSFIPFGGNIEGVEAACHAYFGHGAQQLTAEEIAVLLAIPQRPSVRFPTPENEQRLRLARDEIVEWLLSQGIGLDGDDPVTTLDRVRRAAVPTRRRPMPREAPYFAFWLRGRHPGAERIETTLDRNLQQLAEATLKADQERFRNLGIHNGSVVMTDYRTGDLSAVVGGFDFWDQGPGSQIPGFDVPRSPGSALKPLIYAMAIDRGKALPERVVADIPLSYGGYAPGNYDGRFAGLVSLEYALSRSLNIPFVRLLGEVGVESFLATLRRNGFRNLDPRPGHYGLSAAIGAIEVTPLELASVYSTLANQGMARPINWLQRSSLLASGARGDAPHRVHQLLSPGSTFLTARALSRRDRPDFPERRRYRGVSSRVRWKTGTSYGHRDAWAAGFGDRYTAVVWLGNMDNRSSVDLVGADAAGPLLFDLLETAEPASALAADRSTPDDLQWVSVCSETGYLPGAACDRTREALALRTAVPTTVCPFHRAFDIDNQTGLALLPGCRSGRKWKTKSFVVWPTSLRRWLSQKHRTLPQAPTFDPSCNSLSPREPLAIVSPPSGQTLVLMPGLDSEHQEVPFEVEVSGPPVKLSWFVNGEYFGAVSSDDRLWWAPKPGHHNIVVVDPSGQSFSRKFSVRTQL